jgi:antitoxin component YwqK of YwqJK toxin-antitoxin module
MRYLLYFSLSLIFLACNGSTTPAPVKALVDGTEYELTEVAGTAAQHAVRRDPLGKIIEEGYIQNGVKQGAWTTYTTDSYLPETVTSYVDGVLNGPYLEFDPQGRVTLMANYRANQYHGPFAKYRIGRPEQTAVYVDGKLDGVFAEFDFRNGKIKQEVHYKMGVQHGPLRYYNEAGEVTLEYLYQDGERVSGGIIE